MVMHPATGGCGNNRPGNGLFFLIRRLIAQLTYDFVGAVFLSGTSHPCPGPMAYFIVADDCCDLAECEACGYIAVAGTIYDTAHLHTPHKEGLAT